MAIRHWHPLKLGIIWLIDFALLLILWLLASPKKEDQALAILVWLIVSIPVFIITWKWASVRERLDVEASTQDTQSNKALVGFRRELKAVSIFMLLMLLIMTFYLVGGGIAALIFYYPATVLEGFRDSYLSGYSSTEIAVAIVGFVVMVRLAVPVLEDWIPRLRSWVSFKVGLLKLLFKP
jgi:Na+/melibiose symporter-like transporter